VTQPEPGQPQPGPRHPRQPQPGPRDPRQPEPGPRDPGLARERTRLAWRRTAIGFAAAGGIILKTNVIAGAVVLAMSPLIWALGHLAGPHTDGTRAAQRLRLMSITIVVVAVVALAVSLTAPGR
jgi:uncharacterized membrane protein YidH (DUF202 family)